MFYPTTAAASPGLAAEAQAVMRTTETEADAFLFGVFRSPGRLLDALSQFE
jgi:hypothetical protein